LAKAHGSLCSPSTGCIIATIIAAVAVFDMNMENTNARAITPARREASRAPNWVMTQRATVRSSRVFAIPAAMTKPPKKSQIKGCPRMSTKFSQSREVSA
jgi:hypothetical protein